VQPGSFSYLSGGIMYRKQVVKTTALLLIAAFVCFACAVSVTETELMFDAQTPQVTASTPSFWYKIGDTLPSLSVTAEVTDGGALTYQWYEYDFERGIGIIRDGEVSETFTPPAITQERQGRPYRYYVEVTNTLPGATGRKQTAVSVNIEIIAYDADNAQMPRITRQPASGRYLLSARMGLSVGISLSSDVGDGGTISYQWYQAEGSIAENGTPIAGATSSSLALARSLFSDDADEAEGTYYFFVVATNTNTRVTGRRETQTISDVAVVTISRSPDAVEPEIQKQPQGVILFVGDVLAPTHAVSVTADAEDGGNLTYQWYRNARNEISGGTLITGAVADSLQLSDTGISTESGGNYYFYVVITNTNDAATVSKVKAATSNVARVTVQGGSVPTAPGIDLEVLFDKKYQYVRGFGGMDVAWANFPTYTMTDYENMYDPDKLGYNMLRIMVPPNYTDINRTMEELVANKISGAMDRSNYYEFVKLVNRYGGYVLASPWTPPAAWKTNNSVNGGGNLRVANYQDFADYLRTYSQIMSDNGAPIYAVALQNEPTWVAGYDGCEYTPEMNRDFFLKVGHFTKNKGGVLSTPVPGWGGGRAQPWVRTMGGESHNEIATFHEPAMRNQTSRDAIDIIGAHIYGAGPRHYSMATLTDAAGDGEWVLPNTGWNPNAWRPSVQNGTGTDNTDAKEIWMTEHNINGGNSAAYVLDSSWEYVWKFMNDVDLVIRHNQENAFIWWSSKRFYSMIGDGSYGTTDGAIMPRGYGLSHYSRFAKETGMIGVRATGYLGDDATKVAPSNVNNTSYTNDDTSAKITAFVTLREDIDWRKQRGSITLNDITAISLVMYTPTNTGTGGYNLGNVKIKLPDGFIIRNAELMRSTSRVKQQMETVIIGPDRNTAYVDLPVSNIVSIRFIKQ
jgi:O-glycosyl hydrolase